jgi:hypothetical protein
MIRSRLFRSLPAILGLLVIASCSDSGYSSLTAPAESADHRSSGALPGIPGLSGSPTDATGLELRAAWWNKKHKNQVRVSKTIDASGGIISIPETGLTVSFPAGAVAAPITITITADEDYVAYKMEPTGTRFLKDVRVTQSLAATEFGLRPLRTQLFAAYIADDRLKLSGKVPVLELEPSETIFSLLQPLIPQAQVWIIRHFSRYMLASG